MQDRASFIRRFSALFIDSFIINFTITFVMIIVTLTLMVTLREKSVEVQASIGTPLLVLVSLVVWWFYMIYLVVRLKGQSLGKKALGIRIIRADGHPLTQGKLLVRETLGKWISSIFFIGFLLALGKERLAFHDRLTHTLVVKDRHS